MPTLTQFGNSYPNLTAAQKKLLHSARIATQYSTWSHSLSHTRTIALAPLILSIRPDAAQLTIANALLSSDLTKKYPNDVLHYPRLNSDRHLLKATAGPVVPVEGIELSQSDWTVCKKIEYHSDSVDSDTTAYAFWCIASTAPMTFMLGGNAYPVLDGQLTIFDAQVPHALICSEPNATMVAMLSTAQLTPELRAHLGICSRRAGPIGLEKLRLMDNLCIDPSTGAFALQDGPT